jgi:uncharacterized protein
MFWNFSDSDRLYLRSLPYFAACPRVGSFVARLDPPHGPGIPHMTTARKSEWIIISLFALTLPTLSLLPLGGLYLFQHGWLLVWAIAALVVVAIASIVQIWVLSPLRPPSRPIVLDSANQQWTVDEMRAWQSVQDLAVTARVDALANGDTALRLTVDVITVVAKALHAGTADAVWQFTLPEALAISEQVSRRLSVFVVSHIPFGDRLTIAQVLAIYRGRQWIDLAGRLYGLWRVVRIVNPATAITNEARERLARSLAQWGREHIGRRLITAYVEEVGRASIELYGRRLRQKLPEGQDHVIPEITEITAYDLTKHPIRRGVWRQAASATRALAGSLWRRKR